MPLQNSPTAGFHAMKSAVVKVPPYLATILSQVSPATAR
jgi:hypothetical protein